MEDAHLIDADISLLQTAPGLDVFDSEKSNHEFAAYTPFPKDFSLVLNDACGDPVASRHVSAFRIESANEQYLELLEVYEDGSRLIEGQIHVLNLPEQVNIRINIFKAGVTLDDGTTSRTLTASDFDSLGIYKFRMFIPAGLSTNACHSVRVSGNAGSMGRL